jgi:hypothetical protein
VNENLPARREETFDLTTEAGRKRAMEAFDNWGWLLPGLQGVWLLRQAYGFITQQTIDTLEAQKAQAIDLIKAGREQGVDEMKITMDQTAGLDLGSDVEGIPIKAKIGKGGHMIVEVKYKS